MNSDVPSGLKILLGVKGNYTLLIYVKTCKKISVGGLGTNDFHEGYYVYTGSAFGNGSSSLGGRVKRHIRKQKIRRWHIDYLLSDEDVFLKAVVASAMEQRVECTINKHLKEVFQCQIPVYGFGSSDCRQNCGSHLLYLRRDTCEIVEKIAEVYLHVSGAEIIVLKL